MFNEPADNISIVFSIRWNWKSSKFASINWSIVYTWSAVSVNLWQLFQLLQRSKHKNIKYSQYKFIFDYRTILNIIFLKITMMLFVNLFIAIIQVQINVFQVVIAQLVEQVPQVLTYFEYLIFINYLIYNFLWKVLEL